MSNVVLRDLTNDSLVTDCTDEADKIFGGATLPVPFNVSLVFAKSTTNTNINEFTNSLIVAGDAVFQQKISQTGEG